MILNANIVGYFLNMSDNIYSAFDSLSVHDTPLYRPSGGTTYLYRWTDPLKSDEWRKDGYKWRQCGNGTMINKSTNRSMTKTYFQAYDGPKSFTKKFTRNVYMRPDVPDTVLVKYVGDEQAAIDFPHGNTKELRLDVAPSRPVGLDEMLETSLGSGEGIDQPQVTEDENIYLLPTSDLPQSVNKICQERNNGNSNSRYH